jgi:1-acyl-sn-glycerol-3-phosphate acyltransferase
VAEALGWRIDGEFPNRPKFVVALVPHSSNMDFVLTIAVLWSLGLKSSFMIKHTLFWFPLGPFLRWLGGIPVDRRNAQRLVEQMCAECNRRSQLVLGITPQGTRKSSGEFKQGFARIAIAARVPVLPAVLHYPNRTVHLAPIIENLTDLPKVVKLVTLESLKGAARHQHGYQMRHKMAARVSILEPTH